MTAKTTGRWGILGPLVTVGCGFVLGLATPGLAQAQAPPACDETTRSSIQFVGVPSRLVVGREDVFYVDENPNADAVARSPVAIELRDLANGAVVQTFTQAQGDDIYLTLPFDSRGVEVVASAVEQPSDPAGSACMRTIRGEVEAVRRAYFYNRCYSPAFNPSTIIITCADAGFQFRSLRWRHWNKPVARARGIARVNDCNPSCADGTYHRLPARVALSKLRRCPPGERHNGFYGYKRISFRILRGAPYLYQGRSGSFPVP